MPTYSEGASSHGPPVKQRIAVMQFRWHTSMGEIDPRQWNQLADHASPTPLLNHEWLLHLEESGSITRETGWHGQHLTAWEGDRLVGALPMYRRDHSWGEFVFDFAFADVARQIGVAYYPKLVGMSPATPSSAYAPLVAHHPSRDPRAPRDPREPPGASREVALALLSEATRWCRQENIPVLQFNFVLQEWEHLFRETGMTAWHHHGYQWINEGYQSFDQYLARFRTGQRRNIRRERASLEAQGLEARMVAATEAPEGYFHRMAQFYEHTNRQFGPWAAQFLTGRFFTEMPSAVRRHVWFAAAVPAHTERGSATDDPLALAMLVRKGDHLLGRYWGTRIAAPNLHFNLCYYAPMEWAIQEGCRTIDPGMGSEHKVRRGFRSVSTVSMHRFFDPHLEAIFRANIERINRLEEEQIALLDGAVPFRR